MCHVLEVLLYKATESKVSSLVIGWPVNGTPHVYISGGLRARTVAGRGPTQMGCSSENAVQTWNTVRTWEAQEL